MKLKRRLPSEQGLLLTPLIDMIFLIVIFFMINASLGINPAIQVNLPKAYSSEAVLEETTVVSIMPDESIRIGERAVHLQSFVEELRKEVISIGKTSILLQGDESLPYRKVIEIMDLAKIAGVTKISLVAAKKPKTILR